MRLIFATNNKHKLSEIKDILGIKYEDIIFSIDDFGLIVDPEETGTTFKENALIKARALFDELKKHNLLKAGDYIVSDDTGLCIDFLDGAPGIYSARFMGDVSQKEKNLKIIDMMKDLKDEERTAYFITDLAVIRVNDDKAQNIEELVFEGKIDGYITKKIEKEDGFGYDPIFAVGSTMDIKSGKNKTYSNIGVKEKNKISHRARALGLFVQYLEKNHNI